MEGVEKDREKRKLRQKVKQKRNTRSIRGYSKTIYGAGEGIRTLDVLLGKLPRDKLPIAC